MLIEFPIRQSTLGNESSFKVAESSIDVINQVRLSSLLSNLSNSCSDLGRDFEHGDGALDRLKVHGHAGLGDMFFELIEVKRHLLVVVSDVEGKNLVG